MHIEIKSTWDEKLKFFSQKQKDIYFCESYLKLVADEESTPVCAICEEENKLLLLPFLLKKYKEYFDFETPYGYGGPITNTNDNDWIQKALKALFEYFTSQNYIAGFVRFHPLIENADFCRSICRVIDDRKTVIIDTSVSPEEIWQNQINSKNRNMIRKAEKSGLEFIRDNDFVYLDSFKKLYNGTMSRLEAADFYFFNDAYYKKFIEVFKGQGFLGCIRKNDEIISAALFMYEKDYGHYHLAGSNRIYSSLGANNLLLWKVACEMNKEGVKEFHLGGGTDGNEDNSLFKFKRSFSHHMKQFSIGKMIFNEKLYQEICKEWEINNPDKVDKYKNLLLKYRY